MAKTQQDRDFHINGMMNLLENGSLKGCPTSCILEALSRIFEKNADSKEQLAYAAMLHGLAAMLETDED